MLPFLSPSDRVTPTIRAGTAAVLAELLRASGAKVGEHIEDVAKALVEADAASMEDEACQRLLLELADVAIEQAGASCDRVALPLCQLAAGIQVAAVGKESTAQAVALESRLAKAVGAVDVDS